VFQGLAALHHTNFIEKNKEKQKERKRKEKSKEIYSKNSKKYR
jgi:hypothetical protein